MDTDYCTHTAQTVALVTHALGERPLDHVLNPHLHSDHCGGNGALQARYPGLVTALPPGDSQAVAEPGHVRLGQSIERFGFDRLLQPGSTEHLAGRAWHVDN